MKQLHDSAGRHPCCVARNYTQLTIKTLFGEANSCAFPRCNEPLICNDRGQKTVVAQIAHVRSESPDGPRYDTDYSGDVDGPENLLLLCGKHHAPVDRHERLYPVEELERWKDEQRSTAGAGTSLGERDLRALSRLSNEERESLQAVARSVERFAPAVGVAESAIEALRAREEDERLKTARGWNPLSMVDEAGNETPLGTDRLQLSRMEQREWQEMRQQPWSQQKPKVDEAYGAIREEVAALHMFSDGLDGEPTELSGAVELLLDSIDAPGTYNLRRSELSLTVKKLCKAANGEPVGNGSSTR